MIKIGPKSTPTIRIKKMKNLNNPPTPKIQKKKVAAGGTSGGNGDGGSKDKVKKLKNTISIEALKKIEKIVGKPKDLEAQCRYLWKCYPKIKFKSFGKTITND